MTICHAFATIYQGLLELIWPKCFDLILPALAKIFDNNNYSSVDPKQQQTTLPRRSCAIKKSLGAPFLRKKRKKRRETSPGTRARNQKEPENHDGTQSCSWNRNEQSRETSPGTLAGTRREEEIMMKQDATTLGRQTPQPFLEPDGTTTWWWDRMPED